MREPPRAGNRELRCPNGENGKVVVRIKDARRVPTRYSKLARHYQSTVALASAIACWLRTSLNFRAHYTANAAPLCVSPDDRNPD